MTFNDWIQNAKGHIRERGIRTGGKAAASEFYAGAALRFFDHIPNTFRDNVFDFEWDVLIVLDACRYDAFRTVAPEYDWIDGDVRSIRSVGSMSEEWLENSFTDEYSDAMRETGHVTWNAFSNHVLDESEWAFLDELWKHEWDDELGCIPPAPVTDRAITRWRESRPERMLVHYQQPHTPYRSFAESGLIEPLPEEQVAEPESNRLTVWKLLRRGEIRHERAWEAYLDNLRWVLNDIARLCENLDAEKAVITSDHGDCFGEWNGLYGHPRGVPVPELIKVPWVEIDAHDTHTAEPAVLRDTTESVTAHDRLQALGYET